MKFITRRRERKAHAERVARWEEAMARWESRETPVIIKFDAQLSEEDIANIQRRFRAFYRDRGMRSPL